MRALIAFDKFKDALSARQACDAAARALRRAHPDWLLDLCPLADGGDGFLDVLVLAAGSRKIEFPVMGPRGGTVQAAVGMVPVGNIPSGALSLLGLEPKIDPAAKSTLAVVEMAAASGLALLPPELRDPWQATSYGTGQLIRAAAEMDASAVLLGVGGSATHDLGFGALAALGLEFRTADGRKLKPPLPFQWAELERIDGELFPSIPQIRIACDVSNPLLGPNGAPPSTGRRRAWRLPISTAWKARPRGRPPGSAEWRRIPASSRRLSTGPKWGPRPPGRVRRAEPHSG